MVVMMIVRTYILARLSMAQLVAKNSLSVLFGDFMDPLLKVNRLAIIQVFVPGGDQEISFVQALLDLS